MRPLSRKVQSRGAAKRQFKAHGRRTKAANVAPPPMRGGFRI